jgi:uncharacterized protein YwgA
MPIGIRRLAGFVKALESIGFNFNVRLFNNRLKLQKYVFLAKQYGIDLGYNFNLYVRGPYSPMLAEDYYRLSEEIEPIRVGLPEDFIKLIKNKSERWLELASTVVMVKNRYPSIDDEKIIKIVLGNKPFTNEEELKEIICKLRKHKAIS